MCLCPDEFTRINIKDYDSLRLQKKGFYNNGSTKSLKYKNVLV